jgi:hypothetical protein
MAAAELELKHGTLLAHQGTLFFSLFFVSRCFATARHEAPGSSHGPQAQGTRAGQDSIAIAI